MAKIVLKRLWVGLALVFKTQNPQRTDLNVVRKVN
jgi:hypothetical protein